MKRVLSMMIWIGVPALAQASGNVCFHDGKPIDDRTTQKPFTGEYTCKDMDKGTLTLREHRVADLKEGPYEKFNSWDGKLDESGSYRHDKLHGAMRRYGKDGKPYLEYNYVDGKTQGAQKDFKDGKLSRLYLIYGDGKLGNELSFNAQGQLTHLGCHDNKPIEERDRVWCGQNGKQSSVTLYSEDGKKSAVEQYLDGVQNGVQQRFNVRTGKLMRQNVYDHGKSQRDGDLDYDSDGKLMRKVECQPPDKTTCTETLMFKGGDQVEHVFATERQKNNIDLLRKQTDYYQNGQIKREVVRVDEHFRVTEFNDQGAVETRGTYLPGNYRDSYREDGVVERLLPNGALLSRETYKFGQLDGASLRNTEIEGHAVRYEESYTSGAIARRKVFVDDKPITEWTYFPDGSVKSTQNLGPSPLKPGSI